MRRWLKIALNIVLWGALAAYLFFAMRYCERRNADRICAGLNISIIQDRSQGLATPEFVRGLLVGQRMRLTGVRLDQIDLLAVERAIAGHPYIGDVQAYMSLDNRLNIEVVPRRAVARIQTENGYRFYLSADGYAMPVREAFWVDVPMVTGMPELPVDPGFFGKIPEKKSPENMFLLHNLLNFVKFLNDDAFWSAQIVQIVVTQGNKIELVPRVGRGIIRMGSLEDYERKLAKLFKFYTRGLNYQGWDRYGVIDVSYKGQVVCLEPGQG